MIKTILLLLFLGFVFAATAGLAWYFVARSDSPLSAYSADRVAPTPTPSPSTATTLPLSITTPISGAVVTSSTVTIRGTTVPRADVSINDIDLQADASGNFLQRVEIDEGENVFDIVATSESGDISEIELTVTGDLSR